jgi:hypothetical protein
MAEFNQLSPQTSPQMDPGRWRQRCETTIREKNLIGLVMSTPYSRRMTWFAVEREPGLGLGSLRDWERRAAVERMAEEADRAGLYDKVLLPEG